MKIVIYQIIPELDKEHLMFNSLEYVKKSCGDYIPTEIYEAVYLGDIEAENCDDLWRIFNTKFPKEYRDRSMSISDVIEIISSNDKSEFYFCDVFAFKEITFEKEKAMTLVLNHNFDSVCEKRKNVSAFFIGTNGLIQVKCREFELSRCKYSDTQLGYRLQCKKIDGSKEIFIFSERPSIIFSECIDNFPRELFYADEKHRRYTVHDKKNLGIVFAWLIRKGYEPENLYGGCKI